MIKLQTAPSSILPLWALDTQYLQPALCAERSWKLMLRRGSCFGTCQLASPISDKSWHASSFLSFNSPPLHSLLSPMPQCTCCSRKCKTDTRLLQHMNHPTSKCIQFLDEVIQISEALWYKKLRAHQQSNSSHTVVADGGDVLMEHSDLLVGSEGDGHSITKDIQFKVPEPCVPPSQFEKYHTEVYHGTAQTYRKGSTFMDKFNDDEHVATREDNLYYPWASCPEWELASFLLCSSLSMATINQFLSLDLVSESLLILHMNDLWPSHIDQTLRTFITYCQRSSWKRRDSPHWAYVELHP